MKVTARALKLPVRSCTQCAPVTNFSLQLDPTASSMEADNLGGPQRLFDEFDDDDDVGGYGYGGGPGKDEGLKVILVTPNRSPAMPPPTATSSSCCGREASLGEATAQAKSAAAALTDEAGGDGIMTPKRSVPVPVLAGGWAGASGIGRYWQARGDSSEARREEEAHARWAASNAEANDEEGDERLLRKRQRGSSGTEVRRVGDLVA